jgi:hypothetical protein
MLIHWQVWLAVGLYVVGLLASLIVLGLLMNDEAGGARMTVGCLLTMVGRPVVQGIMMALVIAFLIPLMLGAGYITPVEAVMSNLAGIAIVGIMAIVIITLISFVPVLGQMITDVPGVMTFLMGALIFRLLVGGDIDLVLAEYGVEELRYPGFLASAGFLLLTGVLVAVAWFGGSLLAAALSQGSSNGGSDLEFLVISGLGTMAGMLPVFMYGSYVGASLRAAIGVP